MIKEIIPSKARRKLLTLFLTNPKTRFYMRELQRKTGEYINSVRLELNRLEEIGIIKSEKTANLKYYQANKKCIIYNELSSIIRKTDPPSILLSQATENIKGILKSSLSSIILFGSYAKNNLNFNDIDILVIAKDLTEDWRKRDNLIIELEKTGQFGISLHIELLTNDEFIFSVQEGAPLLLELSLANKVLYDTGFFAQQLQILKENMQKWGAKKIKNTWEVPELAIKV